MLFGNRGARSSAKKQRKSEAFQPRGEALEQKVLLTLLQLGAGTPLNIAGKTTIPPAGPQTLGAILPFIADTTGFNPQVQGTQTTDPGLGVLETGSVASQGAGYSVAALGDMNLDGSNDYLIGAPGVTQSGSVISPQPVTGTTMSQAFLIFGNRSTTIPSIQSWLSSTPEQRVGVLTLAGQPATSTTPQFNPFTNRGQPYNYDFDGVSFITSMDPNSGLGAFVAAAGPNAFVIGAPNYTSPGTSPGRLYYITATSNFNVASLRSAPIDLDNPQNYRGLTIVTFLDPFTPTFTTSGLGSSFAYVPNLLGDGSPDLVIGESGASLNGKTGNGGVFVFEPSSLPNTAGAYNPVSVQAQSQFTFAGANSGDAAGFSVASAGDVNGAPGGVNDLLIGAPKFSSTAGAAYLVYGGPTLTSGKLNGIVDLSRLEIPTTTPDPTPPQGAVFVGAGNGAMAGYTVSSAGSFNPGVDSLDDFMIGSPGNGAGSVNLFYGVLTGTPNSTGQYTAGLIANAGSPIHLNNPTAPLALTGVAPISASFVGASGGDRAGFSLSYFNATSSTSASTILIGAPGNITAPRGSGSVYEIQGPTTGTFITQSQQLNSTIAQQFTLSFPTNISSSTAVVGFGTSVSAFATGNGDFIAGGPGYTGTLPTTSNGTTTATPLNGAAAIVLAALVPIPPPPP
ncbi:MAG TPA: integrin alpha, partial [Isosphaeraceae bacterium]|nr:integrin alpha [Isosphaeraceae bacterium]